MRLGVALALAGCLALPLAAQSVRGRLEGRIPSAAIPAVDSLIQLAAQEGLPTEPLVQKALEGGAKQVAASRIVAAVQLSLDRKSTRLNSSHLVISYAVFCLKKKKKTYSTSTVTRIV